MTDTNGPTHTISKIARVMDEIAFQTSLLRLHAAVDAASGSGSSSGCSAQAVQDTTTLLEESIARTPAIESRVLRALRERAHWLEQGVRDQAVVAKPAVTRSSLKDQR